MLLLLNPQIDLSMTLKSSRSTAAPPPWMRWFITDVTHGIVDQSAIAPLGCHFYFDAESATWEVTLFVSRTEIVGGPRDGHHISAGLSVDLGKVAEAFDKPPVSWWQSEPVSGDDDLGSHVSFEGVARGFRVWLRILHNCPTGVGPGRLMHAAQGVVEDLW